MATRELRPMSTGEILDAAFALYRRHFGPLIGIAIVCYGIPAIMDVYIELRGGIAFVPVLWVLARILEGVGGLVAAGATVKVVSDAFLGTEPYMGDAMQFASGRIFRILVAGLAKYILIIIGFILLIVPGIVVACGYAVVVQVVVLEKLSAATDALGRSWTLTRGFKGKVFGLGVVLFLLLAVPVMAAAALAALLPGTTVIAALVQLAIYPVFGCAFTLLYYDLRVRKEAFDLEHLSKQLGIGFEPAAT